MLCCSTGKMTDGTCFAQDLANMLGVDVIAPDTVIFADENGVLKKGRFEKFERKDFKHFTPKR